MPFDRAEIAAFLAEETEALETFEQAVERVDALRRVTAVERTRLWRALNPKKYKALRRRCAKNWRRRHPEEYRAQKQRYRDRHREQVRKTNLRAVRKYRAKKRMYRD